MEEISSGELVFDSFESMHLREGLLRGIYEYGYKKPSIIQRTGIVPFGCGFDLVTQGMWGPERTSMYCIGVLQRLDLDVPKCQCLILAFGCGEVREIAAAMQKLGQFLGVKVFACLGAGDISKDSPHVVVGSPYHVLKLLRTNVLCSEEIKVVVLDEAKYLMCFDSRLQEVYDIIEYIELKRRQRVQIGAFSEAMPEEIRQSITNKIRGIPIVTQSPNGYELSLGGINRHAFVKVEKEDKVKELVKIIRQTRDTYCALTVVFVRTSLELNSLTKELESNQCNFTVTRSCMDQKERDKITEDFLQSRLLLTTCLWSRGIIEECSDQVGFIVNYDFCEDYICQLGCFGRVSAAISFATSDDWYNLVWLQQEHNIAFERLQPCEDWADFWSKKRVKVSTIKEAPIKHFISNVVDEEGKLLEFEEGGLDDLFAIAGISVIFVNCPDQMFLLADKLKLGSKYKVLTSKDSWDSLLCDLIDTRPRVFITTDEGIILPVKSNLVINFDVPLTRDNYDRRLGWCRSNAIFLLLGTEMDWFEVLAMQVYYGVFITWLPCSVADILKEMVLSLLPLSRRKARQRVVEAVDDEEIEQPLGVGEEMEASDDGGDGGDEDEIEELY